MIRETGVRIMVTGAATMHFEATLKLRYDESILPISSYIPISFSYAYSSSFPNFIFCDFYGSLFASLFSVPFILHLTQILTDVLHSENKLHDNFTVSKSWESKPYQ